MEQGTQPAAVNTAKRDLASLMAMAANIGVLAGLIFVAVQIRQNTAAQRASAYQAWLATNAQLNMALTNRELSNIVATGHPDSKNLSQDTHIAYSMWIISFMQMVQATDYLYHQGAIDEHLWRIEVQRAALHLTFPGVKQWWDAGGKTQLSPEFARRVESASVNMRVWDWDKNQGFTGSDVRR